MTKWELRAPEMAPESAPENAQTKDSIGCEKLPDSKCAIHGTKTV